MLTTLQQLFERDLMLLKSEIQSYSNEEKIWYVEKNIANSAGNLCLHLVGNLNTYIGATLGQSGYVRDRPLEFSLKNVPREELLSKIDATITVIKNTLARLDPATLSKEYPLLVFQQPTSTEYFLIHLATHLTYHLGQMNYHRRLLDSN